MKTNQFASFLSKLEKTPLRNEITQILAQLFKKSSEKEIDKVCYLVLGILAPSYSGIEFNLAEKMMIRVIALAFKLSEERVASLFKKHGDLGVVAVELRQRQGKIQRKQFSIEEIYRLLLEIAQESGTGSQDRKVRLMAFLVESVDDQFLRYLVRMPVGKLRLGFSEKTILDALSWMETGDKSLRPQIEKAYNVLADIGLIAKTFISKGVRGLNKIQPETGVPVLCARAERLPSPEKIIEKLGKCAVEPKFDGFRFQIHIDRDKKEEKSTVQEVLPLESSSVLIKIYSRNLENTTHMFPEVVKAAQELLNEKPDLVNCILDGEGIGIDPKTDKMLAFQKTAQRKRKYNTAELSKEVPLKVFVFDVILYNRQSLLTEPFSERRKVLKKLIDDSKSLIQITPQKYIDNAADLRKEFLTAIKEGFEGIMCKKPDSLYQAGARNFNWVKYKKGTGDKLLDTIDCLVMGYYRGKGKRTKFGIGAFLVGVYDEKGDRYDTIAKIGTGLRDEQWRELRKKCDPFKTKVQPIKYNVNKNLKPDVWCQAGIVVEIKADEITKSPIHTAAGGVALRFPRLERFRDKSPDDITTEDEILSLIKAR